MGSAHPVPLSNQRELPPDKASQLLANDDMGRRIEIYRRYHRGYGEILVQLNVEDARLGVAE